ncbi:hypothetical protein HPULCUR_008425 [Helicostylum pulchrum]|uniref:Uncharacterized protein n=1 Tax=Helicostylum pulchrum TaxID=562976 RepID=A0ABP9Y7I9_9FUNG
MAERAPKKQKTDHEVEEVDFNQKWIEFLADAEQSRNFHRYRFSSHPSADKEVYRQLKKQLRPCETTEIWVEADNFISEIITGRDIDEFKNDIEAKAPVFRSVIKSFQ